MGKDIKAAISCIDGVVESVRCEDLHHPLKWRHKEGYICPAEYHIQRQWHLIKEYMNKVVDSELE